jgi:primosomal protein N' (replication factor Y)
MHFYEVWVRSTAYRGSKALTYCFESELTIGSIVSVPLQRKEVLAIVVEKVSKPKFKTKPITAIATATHLPKELIELGKQIIRFYPAPIGVVAHTLLPAELSKSLPGETAGESGKIASSFALPALTSEQTEAVRVCSLAGSHLLHGKTGTGKTRVYIELALLAFAENKSVIVLTPEISLTSQLVERFREVFDGSVRILHSGLTPKDRRESWAAIANANTPQVIIGARSALFSPSKNVGLVVVDEAHEPAYKQETAPYYHAVRVASLLASVHHASLVIGTATPSVVDYYIAEQKESAIVTMNKLATTSDTTGERVVIDATDRSLFSRSPYISDALIKSIQGSISRGEQSMLYLNKRGTARSILCDQCGWQALCPHCDLPLTYHADSHNILCHSCTFRGHAPTSCPECGNPSVVYRSAGTKLIVEEVSRLFPEARVQRFDTDNLKADRLEQHYESLKNGNIDIIVGTQLLAKGLDLPLLSTLGVIAADSSLAMPDFTSQERTFQLLNQVLGRVGRGHRASTAIIQTFNPGSRAVKDAVDDNWNNFYASELNERKTFMFPPFCFLLKLSCRRATAKAAEKAATDLRAKLEGTKHQVLIEGPAPAFHEKVGGKYEWQLIIKSKQRSNLLTIIAELPSSGWTYDIDPINLL